MASSGLILDRDGTLTEERGYIARRGDLRVLDGVAEALDRARAAGWITIMVSNQSAVGRGIVAESDLVGMHDWLCGELGLAAAYYCPHLPEDGCTCRKPKPGMLQQAVRELDLDPDRSVYVGDNITDVRAAVAAGLRPVLVRSGHGRDHEATAVEAGAIVVDDVAALVELLVGDR